MSLRAGAEQVTRPTWVARASLLLAALIGASSAYGLGAADPYRDLPEATLVAARAQDVCSVVVAALLALLAARTSLRAHVLRLGLLAYVAYSYAIYLVGIPVNRLFLVYVVLVSVSGALLLDGLVRLRPAGWPSTASPRLRRGTGWLLVAVAVLFAGLWLSVLLPHAFGGPAPSPAGPGGVAYPVFVLDLVVVLPCVGAVGVMLLRDRPVAVPLAVVVLVKIITLFTALWAGVVVGLLSGVEVHLAADAGPSLLMLAACGVLLTRWWRALPTHGQRHLRAGPWEP